MDEPPLSLTEVLSEEYEVLRPQSGADQPAAPLTELCLSGGGIRSATFALNVIQGLAERRVSISRMVPSNSWGRSVAPSHEFVAARWIIPSKTVTFCTSSPCSAVMNLPTSSAITPAMRSSRMRTPRISSSTSRRPKVVACSACTPWTKSVPAGTIQTESGVCSNASPAHTSVISARRPRQPARRPSGAPIRARLDR
jgi:hypothetical protein